MNKQRKEPINYPKIWIAFGILLALITPWYFPGSFDDIFIFGLPLWAIIIIIASLMLSATLSYVIKHFWMIEEEKEEIKGKE
ncbi:hypothetical protein SAMN05216238_1143 [Lentibacillus persicus]|uniref:Uncharacterized protein n=1 Tax=Lentibacillus persicus TaxID=640948 RepID=A0A1I2A0J2_9BACI|nr:hypothetical protein [Lentibacillus persicus]SFE37128.1 hypothetical protein SAMN05216238_1143 [Lentibacillus persicus]